MDCCMPSLQMLKETIVRERKREEIEMESMCVLKRERERDKRKLEICSQYF